MLTLEYLESLIAKVEYFYPHDTTMTICALTTRNGFTVIGESACIKPEMFDMELGKKIARTKAVDKLWALEGYVAKERTFNEKQDALEGLSPKEMYERRRKEVLGE